MLAITCFRRVSKDGENVAGIDFPSNDVFDSFNLPYCFPISLFNQPKSVWTSSMNSLLADSFSAINLLISSLL